MNRSLKFGCRTGAAALILFLFGQTVSAQLPDVPLLEEWTSCDQKEDCAIVTEACRSCGSPVVLNKKYLGAFSDADNELRKKTGFVRSCEACSVSVWKIDCLNHRCHVYMQIAGPTEGAKE